MLKVRKSEDRGAGSHGWLNSKHTFSFANYHDDKFMGFRSLRVINEDRIDGGTGFDAHPHRNMEIISYVVKGALVHTDSMGNNAIIKPGEVQKMSAGNGVIHSEYNHIQNEKSHFFQIWIEPKTTGGSPNYGHKSFADQFKLEKLVLVVSESGREGSIQINQNVDIYISNLKQGEDLEFKISPNRGIWIQVISGKLSVNNIKIEAGDGVAINDENLLQFIVLEQCEFILFDLL
jgi:redox-sensitive bicupin YhaK (pirin superfamily)